VEIKLNARRGISNPELKTQVDRLLRFALGRFVGRISRVEATLSDENGPKGGEDKLCRLLVRLTTGGRRKTASSVLVEEVSPSILGAVSIAADRAARAVARTIDRQRFAKPGSISANGE